MPVATPKQFAAMLDAAQASNYAYPAINCSSIVTINAALRGFAERKSDGIIQFSTGAGEFASGTAKKDLVVGCITLAEAVHRLADQYDILVGLHTDHCQPDKAESFLKPLIQETINRRAKGQKNLFTGHMLDASALSLADNIKISKEYLALCAQNELILEIEAGVVGGEEDGAAGSHDTPHDKLYTTPKDMMSVHDALQGIGRYLFAATFGNVHGHYKPGAVKLRPDILRDGQAAVMQKYGKAAEFDLVFHGGSGSEINQIHETLQYGVVKMNIDTDGQYAFTRAIVDHMFKKYDEVLMIDGEVGVKKSYDPRTYLKKAEESMAKRVSRACDELCSTQKSLFSTV